MAKKIHFRRLFGTYRSMDQRHRTRPVLQECRSAGMVVLQTTAARNGGPRTYNARNVGPTRPLFLVTLVLADLQN